MIIKRGLNTVLSVNPLASSTCTREVMGEEAVKLAWEQAEFTELRLGDYITYEGSDWSLDELPAVKKNSSRSFRYDAVFRSTKYRLGNVMYMLFDNTSVLPKGDFPLTGTAEDFMQLLIANLNRVAGSTLWTLGNVVEDTEVVTLTFNNEDCLTVLGRLADEFDTEYHVNNHIIHLKRISTEREITLQYGSTLYDIERTAVDSSSLVTRLYPFGSTRNLPADYRGGNSPLRLPESSGDYIESNVDLYGIIEQAKTFDKIYPRLGAGAAGTVTAVGDKLTFTDSALDFDINDCLLDGVEAKVHFNTGECAGYDFSIKSYKHDTKTFVLIENTQEANFVLPTDLLKPAVGDKYVLIDIVMPEVYRSNAEYELLQESEKYMEQNNVPKVAYKAAFSSIYAKQNLQNVECGDTVTVVDPDMGIDEKIRIVKIIKGITDYWTVQIDLSNTVTKTTWQRITTDIATLQDDVVTSSDRINKNALRSAKNAAETRAMVFDPDGYFHPENIRPLSIETAMLSVSARSQNFQLSVLLQPNYAGNAQVLRWSSGVLAHLTLDEKEIKEWLFSAGSVTVTGANQNKALYIYARCSRAGATGDIYLSPDAFKFDADDTYWFFLIGILHTPIDGVRGISLTYGQTTINGQFITTGVIKSVDGASYFNLNTGEIGGKIKFVSNGVLKDIATGINEAINEMSIGTRNLVLKSDVSTTSNGYRTVFYQLSEPLKIGVDYTIQIWGAKPPDGYWRPHTNIYGADDFATPVYGDTYYEITFKPREEATMLQIYRAPDSGTSATVDKVQLVEGSKAPADWSPAPEDLQEEIDNLGNTFSDFESYLAQAFKDEVISASEAIAIKNYINTINESMAKAEASYLYVYANSLLSGTPKTNLLNAKINLWGQRDVLINTINTVISDSIISASERTAVNNAFSTFNSYMSAFQTRLEEAEEAIRNESVTTAIDNIEVGAENYCMNSRFTKFTNIATFYKNRYSLALPQADWCDVLIGTVSNVPVGEYLVNGATYTVVAKQLTRISGTGSTVQFVLHDYTGVNTTFVFTTLLMGTNRTATFTVPATGNYSLLLYCGGYNASNGEISAKGLAVINNVNLIGWDAALNSPLTDSRWISYNSGVEVAAQGYHAHIDDWTFDFPVAAFIDRNSICGYPHRWMGMARFLNVGSYEHSALAASQEYTISLDVYSDTVGASLELGLYHKLKGNSNHGFYNNCLIHTPPTTADEVGKWVRRSVKMQLHDDFDNTASATLYMYGQSNPTECTQYATKIKIAKGNIAGDYTGSSYETEIELAELNENIDAVALAQAEQTSAINLARAITDKFGTTIDGGLVSAVVMLLRALDSQTETAGISGIQKDSAGNSLPAFWAGGTYAEAIAGLANSITNHDGSGHLANRKIAWNADGSLLEVMGKIVALAGKIGGLDIFSDTLKSESMSFTENPIETLSSLLYPVTVSIVSQPSWSNFTLNEDAYAYTQPIAVAIDSKIKFKVSATQGSGLIDKYWRVYVQDGLGNRVFLQSGDTAISGQLFTVNVPAGSYSIHAAAGGLAFIGESYNNMVSITGETSSTIYATGYNFQTKIGNNGFYSFWDAVKYIYYSSLEGLTVKGAMDIPGVLLAGRGASGGGASALWGAKKHATGVVRTAAGTYTVYHSIGHTNYSVQVTSMVAQRTVYWANPLSDRFTVYIYNGSTLTDSGFSFAVFGEN